MIVDEARGDSEVDEVIVKFEPNGRWARVGFSWDDEEEKEALLEDLEADQVLDLLSAEEMDGFRTGEPPTAS